MGVYEVMYVTPTIRHMITENVPGPQIMAEAFRSGMQPIIEYARTKIPEGHTTVEEVLRVVAVEAI